MRRLALLGVVIAMPSVGCGSSSNDGTPQPAADAHITKHNVRSQRLPMCRLPMCIEACGSRPPSASVLLGAHTQESGKVRFFGI